MCSADQILTPAGDDVSAVDLEADVDANRSDRRAVADAEARPRCAARRGRSPWSSRTRCRCRRSRRAPRPPRTGTRSSAFRITSALPPIGKPSWSIVAGVPSWSSAKPRTVVSPPAKKRSLAGRSRTVSTTGWPCRRHRSPHRATVRGKPVARPTRALVASTTRLRLRHGPEQLRRQIALEEADLRADPPRGDLPVGAQIAARRSGSPDRRGRRGWPTARTTTAGPAETAGRSAAARSGSIFSSNSSVR